MPPLELLGVAILNQPILNLVGSLYINPELRLVPDLSYLINSKRDVRHVTIINYITK